MSPNSTSQKNLPLSKIVSIWWPLAASWMLMGAELPALCVIVARLKNPEINLAAYSGIVLPLALIIESPIIMLLAASTALSKDWVSYRKVYRYMMVTGAALTALHVLVAFTPLYYVVARGILGAPEVIVEPGRIGLMIMMPWTWSIAYRRFHQGVLIRFGRSGTIGVGTVIRLCVDGFVLAIGFGIGTMPGIIVATSAVAAGVICEAVYVGIAVRPVLAEGGALRQASPVEPALTRRAFVAYYFPLVMTQLLTLLVNPIGSAAMSRMPHAIDSLATWSVVSGLVFMARSLGIAYNEVVVALLDLPRSSENLRRFAGILAVITTSLLLIMTISPLAGLWFGSVSALRSDLAELARVGLWFALPLPALSVLQSWFQGAILFGRSTRAITEAVVVYLITSMIILGWGVLSGRVTGLFVGLAAMTASMFTQTVWLWVRSRTVIQFIEKRDQDDRLANITEAAN